MHYKTVLSTLFFTAAISYNALAQKNEKRVFFNTQQKDKSAIRGQKTPSSGYYISLFKDDHRNFIVSQGLDSSSAADIEDDWLYYDDLNFKQALKFEEATLTIYPLEKRTDVSIRYKKQKDQAELTFYDPLNNSLTIKGVFDADFLAGFFENINTSDIFLLKYTYFSDLSTYSNISSLKASNAKGESLVLEDSTDVFLKNSTIKFFQDFYDLEHKLDRH